MTSGHETKQILPQAKSLNTNDEVITERELIPGTRNYLLQRSELDPESLDTFIDPDLTT
jgi:hypothetical protein